MKRRKTLALLSSLRGLLLLGLLFASSTSLHAAIDAYPFKSAQDEERFQQLTQELRCPKCQNQNIADSDSPIAADLRHEVYRMLEAGEPDDAIVDFMVTRYGEFVLYRPRVNEVTWMLWFGPFVLLAIGLLVVVVISRQRRRRAPAPGVAAGDNNNNAHAQLAPAERERLEQLLRQDAK